MESIEFRHLTHDEEGRMWYQGKLFTGIAIDYWLNGQLASEVNLVDGIEDGWSRLWSEGGTLTKETFYQKGRATGIRREWHSSGQLKLEKELEDAICLQSREWDEHGNLVDEYLLKEDHPDYRDLQITRSRKIEL